eukprot:GHVR01075308.1.p1 GENE.GHVR01075308.1~~GHVR01075308.1.p1  ORF type:complete len:174 (+),score=23.80 GHVR01075308.1:124-645(+)
MAAAMQSQWGLGAWALAMIFVAGVEGFCISAPPATASRATGARVRLGLKMATTTQRRYGAPQRKGQKSDWWEEITQEIFQGEKIPLSAKDLADQIMSSYYGSAPSRSAPSRGLAESSDVFLAGTTEFFATFAKNIESFQKTEKLRRNMTPGERTLCAAVARSVQARRTGNGRP